MTKSLEQQCVAALTAEPPPTLDQLLTLIAETEAGIIEAENDAEIAKAEFFDPILAPDIRVAQQRMESTQHTAARLRTLLPRLQDRAREVEAEAERQEWQTNSDLLADERNVLAKEFRQTYPAAVSTLVSLFARAANLDHRLSELHGRRPAGCKGTLLGVELTARNLTEFSRDQPSILGRDRLQLPDWTDSSRMAWPPRETPASVMIAEAVAAVHDPRRHSGDWAAALREENARRVAEEQQRIEQEARRTTEDKAAYERALPR